MLPPKKFLIAFIKAQKATFTLRIYIGLYSVKVKIAIVPNKPSRHQVCWFRVSATIYRKCTA